MSDTLDLNASIKIYGNKGVVLFLKGRGLNACPMTQRGSEILIKLCKRSSSELLPAWPVPEDTNDRYYKLRLELESGAMISRLPGNIVQSILESGADNFDLMIRGHSRELKVECLKQGSISKDQALGNEINYSSEYVDTGSEKDNTSFASAQSKNDAVNTDNKDNGLSGGASEQSTLNQSANQAGNDKGNNKILLFAGLGVLAALLLAAAIYFMLFSKSADAPLQETQPSQESSQMQDEATASKTDETESQTQSVEADTTVHDDSTAVTDTYVLDDGDAVTDSTVQDNSAAVVDTTVQDDSGAVADSTVQDDSAAVVDTTVQTQTVQPVIQTEAQVAGSGKCSVAGGYDSSVIASCAKEGTKDEIIAFIKQAVADNKCESAVNVLLYRARHEKSDPTFAFKLAQFYDSKASLSLPCLNKDDKAASYYYDIAKKLQAQ